MEIHRLASLLISAVAVLLLIIGVLHYLNRPRVQIKEVRMGFVILNGEQMLFRAMDKGEIIWTSKIEEALMFARRSDAETFAYDDEEAFFVRGVSLTPGFEPEPARGHPNDALGKEYAAMQCHKAPAGWVCALQRDHDGPCAAVRVATDQGVNRF